MAENTASAIFTLEELWLLQSVIRHEMAQMESWKAPPVSLALNDQVAEALLFCHENNVGEAAILLTRADCLAIDFCVPQNAKSPVGVPTGRQVLLKSYHARADLDRPWRAAEEEPAAPTPAEIATRLEQWKRRRRGKRSV